LSILLSTSEKSMLASFSGIGHLSCRFAFRRKIFAIVLLPQSQAPHPHALIQVRCGYLSL
jgi:hypothetical protein